MWLATGSVELVLAGTVARPTKNIDRMGFGRDGGPPVKERQKAGTVACPTKTRKIMAIRVLTGRRHEDMEKNRIAKKRM
jgi:hypothetical protein